VSAVLYAIRRRGDELLDRYVAEMTQMRSIRNAANAWCVRAAADLDTAEYETARRLWDEADRRHDGIALSYIGANEYTREAEMRMKAELAGKRRRRD
jgi:hypothetical protein